jgi:hypothetical protein
VRKQILLILRMKLKTECEAISKGGRSVEQLPGLLPTYTNRLCACEATVKLNRLFNLKTVHQEAPPQMKLQRGLAIPPA